MKSLTALMLLSLGALTAGCGWCDRTWGRRDYCPPGYVPQTYQYPTQCCQPTVAVPAVPSSQCCTPGY